MEIIERYIVGRGITGFNRIEIEDAKNIAVSDDYNEFVVIVTGKDNDKIHSFYTSISSILQNNNLCILVYTRDCNIWKPLAMLMAVYGNRNVYRAESEDMINTEFIRGAEKHRPMYLEESIVHGGDIVAFNEVTKIILGISNLVANNDTEGMKKFMRANNHVINGVVEAIDYMKFIVDQSNKSELEKKLKNTQEERTELADKVVSLEKINRRIETEKNDIEAKLKQAEEDLRNASVQIKTAEAVNESGATSSIRDYPELNTVQIKSRIGRVLYFKELSRVPYIDSLVWALFEELKLLKVKAKLMIYDYDADMGEMYEPIEVLTSAKFVGNKRSYVAKTDKLVFVEPNPTAITEVARVVPAYDVVIIYDRMHQKHDIIKGREVTKFYVCGNRKAYDVGVKNFGIKSVEDVIAPANSGIGGSHLDIPEISDYNKCTVNAKVSKYMKLIGTKTGKSIAKTIFEQSKIDEFFK